MNELANSLIEQAGFTVLGGFRPNEADQAPRLASGATPRFVLLVGNAGPGMFERFSRACDPQRDSLDDWCQAILDPIAELVQAKAVYPWQKPFLPFLSWAQKAGAGRPSPLGMNIHPEYGLWYGFRGAFLFQPDTDLPAGKAQARHPCETCLAKPCLSACPVDAFVSGKDIALDTGRCVDYLGSANGKNCLKRGCKARLACPVGENYAYSTEQIAFHLSAFYRSCTQDY